MLLGKEGNLDRPNPTDVERDCDIHTLSALSTKLDGVDGMFFVLTGSYAVEALTQHPFSHGDMDSNIFTTDIPAAKRQVAKIVGEVVLPEGLLKTYREVENSLWYMVNPNDSSVKAKRLELQFVEFSGLSRDLPVVFNLKGSQGNSFRVPTMTISLIDSSNRSFDFRCKSLAYVIASWALRISDVAEHQKRTVVPSDLDNFSRLLSTSYDYDEVIEAIRYHPQMPKNFSEAIVFETALIAVSSK